MKTLLLALALVLPVAHASELDNEKGVTNAQRMAANLPKTLVVRVDSKGNAAVMHSKVALQKGAKINDSKFVPMKRDQKQSELDGDSSASGWYFYWNHYNYAYPTYNYYGYNYYYRPYNSYYYGGYNYYWYRWY